MPWPTVTEELRNDVRFALRFKVGRKQQPLTDTRAPVINLKTAKELGLNVPPGAARTRRRGDRIGHHNRAEGVLVARAIRSPTFSLKVGVSNGAISLQYIHSRTDLSVLITFSGKRFFSVSF
jgi:hypothetical protein